MLSREVGAKSHTAIGLCSKSTGITPSTKLTGLNVRKPTPIGSVLELGRLKSVRVRESSAARTGICDEPRRKSKPPPMNPT